MLLRTPWSLEWVLNKFYAVRLDFASDYIYEGVDRIGMIGSSESFAKRGGLMHAKGDLIHIESPRSQAYRSRGLMHRGRARTFRVLGNCLIL
jgi:hypothetical protein